MKPDRTIRLNSLLKQVIAEVLMRKVKNPYIHELTTITRVSISRDLKTAKVYVSVIGTKEHLAQTLQALRSASGFIAITASKKVVMRYFPALDFVSDDSLDEEIRIESLLDKVAKDLPCPPQ